MRILPPSGKTSYSCFKYSIRFSMYPIVFMIKIISTSSFSIFASDGRANLVSSLVCISELRFCLKLSIISSIRGSISIAMTDAPLSKSLKEKNPVPAPMSAILNSDTSPNRSITSEGLCHTSLLLFA